MFDTRNYNESSFRGVPFYTMSTDLSGGHRLTDHNFINGGNLSEDNGLKNKEFKVIGYIGGYDYLSEKEALITAFDIQGSGTFIDMFYGRLEVQVDTYTIKESKARIGFAEIEISFKKALNEVIETTEISFAVDLIQETLSNFRNDFNNGLGLELMTDSIIGINSFLNDLNGNIKFLDDIVNLNEIKDAIRIVQVNLTSSINNVNLLSDDILGLFNVFGDSFVSGANSEKSFTNGLLNMLSTSNEKVYTNYAQIEVNDQIKTYTNAVISGLTQTAINNLENIDFTTGDDFGSVKDDILSIFSILEDNTILDDATEIDEIVIKQNLIDKYHDAKSEFIFFYTQKYSGLQTLKENNIVATVDALNLTMDKYNDIGRVSEILVNNDIIDPIFMNGNIKMLER